MVDFDEAFFTWVHHELRGPKTCLIDVIKGKATMQEFQDAMTEHERIREELFILVLEAQDNPHS